MLTIEQVNDFLARVTENNSDMHICGVSLAELCTLARERLEAGTFNEGIEAAAAYHIGCQKEQLAAFNNGASLNNTAIRLEAHKTSADAIRNLKRPS